MRYFGVLLGGASVAIALSASAAPRSTPLPGQARPDKKACIAASESAQKLRREGKFHSAREQLLICARTECPGIVRTDCGEWLNELESAMPSVVVAARDTNGKETLAVRVSVDGNVVLPKLDGKSIVIDPGVHQFKYESDDGLKVEEQLAIREGEKNRVLYVNFHKPAPADTETPKPAPPPNATPSPSQSASTSSPPQLSTAGVPPKSGIPVGAWVFGALGIAGTGVGTYLFFSASGDVHDLQRCAPYCSHADVDSARSKALVADVAFGAAAVAFAASLWMAVVSPNEQVETSKTGLHFDVRPTTGGAAGAVHGAF